MHQVSDAVSVAKSQVGYQEGRKGNDWDNNEKYAAMLPGFATYQNQPWCAVFAQFVFWFVGVDVPTGAKSASCAVSVAAYKKAKRWTEYPVTGAQVFYGPGGGEHCGIVTSWDDTYVYTVEGNTNTNGSAEGDGVYSKKRVRRDTYVYGYGIPYYSGKGSSPDPAWNGRSLAK